MSSPDKILAQIEDWRSRLLDLTKRNRLINCKIGPTSALELLHPDPVSIWDHLGIREVPLTFAWKTSLVEEDEVPRLQTKKGDADATDDILPEQRPELRRISLEQCLASPHLKSEHILTEITDAKLATRLKRLGLNAKTSIEEQGVNVLFAAFGLLEWYESPQSEIPFYAPLLLLPVSLHRPGPDELWSLETYENEIVENQCLREMLKASFRFELPSYAIDADEDAAPDPFAFFERLESFLAQRQAAQRWKVHPKVILGTFSFQKIAMWEDLGKNGNRVASHAICRGIAGDVTDGAFGDSGLPSPTEFDSLIAPTEVHSVLDSDSSQFEAILAAKRGVSLVVDGPPGTGKSQTIANIIAECLADKKTVLFVSEKAAALDVVKRRLDDQRLGDFCLECHSHKANKKEVIAELRRCLALPSERYRDQSADLLQLSETRNRLNAYVKAIHLKRGALEISAFKAHGRLATLKPMGQTRASVKDPLTASNADLREILLLLKGLEGCTAVFASYRNHPWRGAIPSAFSLTMQDEIRDTLSGLSQAIEALAGDVESLSQLGLISPQPRAREVGEAIQRAKGLLQFPRMPRVWFDGDPSELARAMEGLHDAEQNLARLIGDIPQFQAGELKVSPTARHTLAMYRNDEILGRVRIDGALTLRGLKQQVEVTLNDLSELRGSLLSLRDGIADLSRNLQIRIDANSSLGVLHKLTSLGATIAKTGALKSAWFDPAQKAELLKAEASCRVEIDACREVAEKRKGEWSGEAFRDEGASIATEGKAFETFGARLWASLTGRWGAFHRRLRQLYVDQPPKDTASILADLHQLRTYHRRLCEVRSIELQYKDRLVFDQRGEADWESLRNGIEAIEHLQVLIKIPDKLRQILCSEGLINRNALRESADAITQELTKINGLAAAVGKQFSLQRLGSRKGSYADLTSSELVAWVEEAEASLANFRATLTEFESLLVPSADIPLAEIPRAVAGLDARSHQAEVVNGMRQQLNGVPGIGGPLVRAQGMQSEDIEAVHALKRLLNTYGERPIAAVIQVVCDGSVRDQIARSASSLEASFRQRLKPYWTRLTQIFPTNQAVSKGVVIDQLTLPELVNWLRDLNGRLNELQEWIEFRDVERRLEQRSLHDIISEVLEGRLILEAVRDTFLARFYRQWLDAVYWSDPILRSFRADDHEAVLESFRALDRDSIDGAYKRIRTTLLQDPARPHIGMMNAPPSSELGILLRESARKRPRLPLRQLFRKIPLILRRLKPCMMMSPLAVSTFLDTPDIEFDVVIFDEASQVRPYDAIGAIYRGKQLLVAGDQKQLPPTSFFDRMDSEDDQNEAVEDDEEEKANIGEYESILDVCCSLGMPRKRLRWHYRSRRESLIAFSNQFFYDNELITFPSVFDVEGCSAVTLRHVADGRWIPGQSGGFNPVEARQTAQLVVRHFEQTPDRSLGVITLNQRQQLAVDEELDKIRRQRPELAEFFDEAKREPFFVKNLENVQGDERDHIILGVAYGFDAQDKFAMRFGPLNQQGGERRLNVAVTRARYGTTVVSSIVAEHIDLSRTKARGAMLLRSFLDFAARGMPAIRAAITQTPDAEHDSEFEAEVERALCAHGLSVQRQIGCSGFRIDLAAVHPKKPGRFVLGIECDGATYHSSATARDRDRLRQEVLEGLGWRICRIWSTDWIRNPERQIERVLAAFQEEVARDNGESLEHATPPPSISEDKEAEQPILRIRRDDHDLSSRSYSSIDDVPESVIRDTVVQLLRQYGKTTREELIKAVAKQLGFQRAGRRIQQKVDGVIETMAGQGRLNWAEEGGIAAI